MTHLHLPTTDHFEPTVQDLERAVQFIEQYEQTGKKVYVHCRAGHGRSAAVVFAWLLSKDPDVDLQELNQELCKIRSVRKTLWKQPNIIRFHSRLRSKTTFSDDDNAEWNSDGDADEL
jgi:atypical dual specificity phosphatase